MMNAFIALVLAALALAPPPRQRVVEVTQFKFSPARLVVNAGDTIVWLNRDAVPHTATANSGAWESGDIPAGAKRIWIARGRGEQPYFCAYHTGMKGVVLVK